MSLTAKPYALHLTDSNGDEYRLNFVISKNDFASDYKPTIIEARYEDGYLFNDIAFSVRYDGIQASEGCFLADTYKGESTVVDGLILDGVVTVTGRIEGKWVEIKPNEEWLASLRIEDNTRHIEPGKLLVEVGNCGGRRYRRASIIHGDFQWTISERNPFYSRWSGDHGYMISASGISNSEMAFATEIYDSIVEAWQMAEQYEKAITEFFAVGERIAKKYGMASFFDDLFTNIAARHWYLEG